jgi:O-antigen ligase
LRAAATAFKPTADPFRNVLFVLMVITISRIHQNFGFLRPFRPALVLVLMACGYAYLNPRYLAVGSMFKTKNARVMLGLGIMACLSVPFGLSMGNSATFILTEYSKVLLFGFLVLLGIRNSRDLYKMVWALVAAAGCLAYLSLFVFKMKAARGDDFVRIQNGYTYDSNDIGVVAIVGVCLTLLTYQVSKSRGKLISGIILAGLAMTIARTGSRGALLGLVAVGGAMTVLLKNVSLDKRIGFVVVMVLGMAVAAPPGYWAQMLTMLAPKQDYNWTSETGRKEVLMRGVGYMMKNPFSGVGVDNFGRAEGMYSARAEAREWDPSLPGIKWSAAHNSFLQAAAEMGIPGILLFCTLVFGSIWQCLQIRKRMPVHWYKGSDEEKFLYYTSVYLPVALIGFAVGGFFVSFAYLDLIYVLAAFVAGLQTSVALKLSGAPAATVTAPPRRVGRGRGGLPGGALPPPVMPRHPI